MFTVNRPSTKRLKLLVDNLNYEHLISDEVEVAKIMLSLYSRTMKRSLASALTNF